ncbi:MAG: BlaI/MecI/CopY family transcriptional regulator [Lachnospiraceae bacterium]|nr:BlaI/MecI/CopY family transcriptional regulator [Lachnospiraceae bacterium]
MAEYRIGEMEAKFANLIWEQEPIGTAALITLCEKNFNWKRTTTYTVLKRLCDRGLFKLENGTVTANIGKKEFQARRCEEFVKTAFDGSLPALVLAYTAKNKLTKKEIKKIKKILNAIGDSD